MLIEQAASSQREINTYRLGKTYCKTTLTRFREHCNEHYNEHTRTDWFHHSWFISLNSFKQVDVCMRCICASNNICNNKKEANLKLEKNGNDKRWVRLNGKWRGEKGGAAHAFLIIFLLIFLGGRCNTAMWKLSFGMWDCKQLLHFSGFEFYFSQNPHTHIDTLYLVFQHGLIELKMIRILVCAYWKCPIINYQQFEATKTKNMHINCSMQNNILRWIWITFFQMRYCTKIQYNIDNILKQSSMYTAELHGCY